MVSGSTLSSPGTVARVAKGLAFLASVAIARNKVTDFICGTVRVAAASSLNAGNQRVALEPWGTNTDGCVEIYLTLGPAATNSGQTWVYTFLVFASLVKGTVPVNLTLN